MVMMKWNDNFQAIYILVHFILRGCSTFFKLFINFLHISYQATLFEFLGKIALLILFSLLVQKCHFKKS